MSDFGSGHDLAVHEFEPLVGLTTLSAEPSWDPLSPSLSTPFPLGSGHDLMVREIEPLFRLLGILFLSLSLCLSPSLPLSQK